MLRRVTRTKMTERIGEDWGRPVVGQGVCWRQGGWLCGAEGNSSVSCSRLVSGMGQVDDLPHPHRGTQRGAMKRGGRDDGRGEA